VSTEQVATDVPLPTDVPPPMAPQRKHTGWWIAAFVALLAFSLAAGVALLWLDRGPAVRIVRAESVDSFGEGMSKLTAMQGHTLWVITYEEPAELALAGPAALVDATGEKHTPGVTQTTVVDGRKERTVSLIYALPDGRKPLKIRVEQRGDMRFGKGRVPARLCDASKKWP
jgi:hypothetical protein